MAQLGIKTTTTLTSLALVTTFSASAQMADSRPNILMILSDDHSAAHVGCYGNRDIVTPNLDKFAGEGIRFNRAYVTSPQSAPSRASVMTGRSPIGIDMTRFYVPLDIEFRTFGEDLRADGYYTGAVGRCHHLDGGFGGLVNHPLEQYLIAEGLKTMHTRLDYVSECPSNDKTSANIHSQFYGFMEARDKDKPFFVQLNYTDPHRAYTAEKFHDPDKLSLFPQYPDTPGVRADLAAYYDEIHRLDTDFGEIMEYLEENNLSENTIVIFMGDNGGAQFRGKGTLYEWGVNVPLLIRWSGVIEPGSVSNSIVSAEDLAPTILRAAELDIRPEITGVDLMPIFKDSEAKVRKYAYAERGAHGMRLPESSSAFDLQRCVIGERYKLIYNIIPQIPLSPVDFYKMDFWKQIEQMNERGELDQKFVDLYFKPTRPFFELYDLENDPWEFNNLRDDEEYQEILEELKYEMSHWMIQERDYPPLPISMEKNVTHIY
ncbi:MAG: sulfatase [Rikenellaceae bacterium]